MLFIAGTVTVASIGGLALLVRELRHAPEGYEDASGFHVLQKKNDASRLPTAGVRRRRSRADAAALVKHA